MSSRYRHIYNTFRAFGIIFYAQLIFRKCFECAIFWRVTMETLLIHSGVTLFSDEVVALRHYLPYVSSLVSVVVGIIVKDLDTLIVKLGNKAPFDPWQSAGPDSIPGSESKRIHSIPFNLFFYLSIPIA